MVASLLKIRTVVVYDYLKEVHLWPNRFKIAKEIFLQVRKL